MLDDKFNQYRQIAEIHPTGEIFELVSFLRLYNNLLDHWFIKTGVMLTNFRDIDSKLTILKQIIRRHPSYVGTQE